MEIEQGRVVSMIGDKDDPASHGYTCKRGRNLPAYLYDSNRLLRPLRKTASGDFEPISPAVAISAIADRLRAILPGEVAVLSGGEGLREVAAGAGADVVVSALVGASGLVPTLEAIEAGAAVALANKEVLVMAGELVKARCRARGAVLLPIDSEHAGVAQALANRPADGGVRRIILTASGGPFRTLPLESLPRVTPSEALRHPTWKMGPKVTIDSASLMNKGLELIEAKWLFGLEPDQVDVLIHPQSIVHALVEFPRHTYAHSSYVPVKACRVVR